MSLKHKYFKKKRPITRKFWGLLKYLPSVLQAKLIRGQFEVDYDLPPELVFKQAETEDEIRQALKIVHDSYVELDYMSPNEAEIRFSKFHALPNTIILVAKIHDEVVGTISIIPDSSLGLPCDMTWNLDKFREQGHLIAEVSSLAIKKTFRSQRGTLLIPLCKIMIQFCLRYLKVDGLVIATTLEVEPFYLHVLLFEKVIEKTGQAHGLVNNNPSTCCYLPVSKAMIEKYKTFYNHFSLKRNLYHFFFVIDLPNFIYPEPRKSLTGYNLRRNQAKLEILSKFPNLTTEWGEKELLALVRLDKDTHNELKNLLMKNLTDEELEKAETYLDSKEFRFDVRFKAHAFFSGETESRECQLLDLSEHGFQIKLSSHTNSHHLNASAFMSRWHKKNLKRNIKNGEKFVLVFEVGKKVIHLDATIRWSKYNSRFGCNILQPNLEWYRLLKDIEEEIKTPPPPPSEEEQLIQLTAPLDNQNILPGESITAKPFRLKK